MKKLDAQTRKVLDFQWKTYLHYYAEGDKLHAEGSKLLAEGDKLWAESILRFVGNIKLEWNGPKKCKLETGDVFTEKSK